MVYFDILDREIRQDATGFGGRTVSSHTVYDARGQATHVSQPFFSNAGTLTAPPADYTVSDYDEIGRVKTQTAPGNRVTSTAFNGLTATATNPLNQSFTTQQDVRGRTGTTTSYGSDAITNIHDPYGNLLEVRDGLGRPVETLTRIGSMRFVTGTTYDEYSRPRLTIYPTGFAVRNVYNTQGFLSEVRDAATGTLGSWSF
jgi:hypothetical protein